MGKMTKRGMNEIEPGIRSLVRAVNAFDALQTTESCEGHPERDQDWCVIFHARHTEAGWLALEFLAWVANDLGRAGENLALIAGSGPPYLNGRGTSLFFSLGGAVTTPPDQVADFLMKMREEYFDPRPRPVKR